MNGPARPAGHPDHRAASPLVSGLDLRIPIDALSEGEFLRAFMDSTPDWLFAKDLEHRFLFANRSFAAAMGLTPADMVGRVDSEFWGSECEPDPVTGHHGFHTDDRRAFAGESVHNPHDHATVADGFVRVFDTVKSPLRARDGTIVGVLCYCRDVTERHGMELALRESEECFRAVVGNIPGSVYRSEVQPPYRDLFLSDGIFAITGYEAREYFQAGGPSCGELILPEDRARVDATVRSALDAREPFQVRYRVRHRDGSIRWVSEQGRATYDAEGRPLYLDGVHIDVTAQMQAEEALREREERLSAIVEHEPECVNILDRQGRVLEMNPAGLRMIDADDFAQVRGLRATTLVVPADRAAFDAMVEAVFRGETGVLRFEIDTRRGVRRTLETHSVPMWNAARTEVRALLGVTRDITEHRRVERERRELEAQLRQSQKMEAMGTLAGGIAHDFNNILTTILGYAELLKPALSATGTASRDLDYIVAAALRARDLVQQILTFSRRHSKDRTVLDLGPVVRDVLNLMRASLPANIEIDAQVAPGCRRAEANSSQLHQVLVNLCANAGYAMRERGGRLTIGLDDVELDREFCARRAGATPGPHLHLSVRDTGCGMAPSVLERIFEPFFTTKAPTEGTGLGLAVVHGIVHGHGGFVTVESRPDHGSTFHLYLPAADRVDACADIEAPAIARGRGERVLVVDDEVGVADMACRMLAQLGYAAAGFHSPTVALADLHATVAQVDLVLCDLTMPGMDGLEFARRVRELRSDLPVVLTSGYGGVVDAGRIAQAGIRAVLDKPFILETLAQMARQHLDSRTASPPPA